MLDNKPHRREDKDMNKNQKRPQSPKRFNRHESTVISKRELAGHGMKAPRYSRNELRMTILSGRFEG